MTKREIEDVLDRVRTWPVERQAQAASLLLHLERQGLEPTSLSEEDSAALDEADAEFERGEVASDEEVEATLSRYPA
jgi:hypothetical protein